MHETEIQAVERNSTLSRNDVSRFPGSSLVFITLICLGLAITFGFQRSHPSVTTHLIEHVDKLEMIDLGLIDEASEHPFQISLRAFSSSEVTVHRIDRTCACTVISPETPVKLAQGETATWNAGIKLNTDEPKSIIEQDGTFKTDLVVVYSGLDDVVRKRQLTVKGRVRRTISLKPGYLNWGTISQLALPVKREQIVTGSAGVHSIRVNPPAGFTAIVEKIADNKANWWKVELTVTNQAQVGKLPTSIAVMPFDSDGKPLPPKQLKILGEISSDVVTDPPVTLLGKQPMGTLHETPVRIYSLTGRPLTVFDSGDVRKVAEYEDVYNVAVPIREGDENVRIPVEYAYDDGKRMRLMIEVKYLGEPPSR